MLEGYQALWDEKMHFTGKKIYALDVDIKIHLGNV